MKGGRGEAAERRTKAHFGRKDEIGRFSLAEREGFCVSCLEAGSREKESGDKTDCQVRFDDGELAGRKGNVAERVAKRIAAVTVIIRFGCRSVIMAVRRNGCMLMTMCVRDGSI